ncbi:DUF3016 domain-containing protein [Alteromonas sp. CYL-A6]|uniref:DUF3016 domain-containing protein n=1 Tax=Alteromonas nitratireducens TaxID=3390813 RepID=UPI0034AFB1BA
MMNMKSVLCLGTAIGIALSLPATAAELTVTWQDPDSYRDVDPANQSRVAFRKQVFGQLEAFFGQLSETLPETYQWSLTVTNLDLAGQVWPASFVGFGTIGSDVRLVRQIDIPRIAFHYTLKDGDGNLVKDADVSLKDMNFLNSQVRSQRWQNLAYEKAMLTTWFNDELGEFKKPPEQAEE